ncbi:hypothetical protein M6B38_238580 [Iris pallida]|uniref:Secreted protein n=1 Tax=Iris pallida TaxID=29817 RepID=A0AAX6DLL1_IRIPA|nr:hypothetical protein M6B38_238580 [Iris pallida]
MVLVCPIAVCAWVLVSEMACVDRSGVHVGVSKHWPCPRDVHVQEELALEKKSYFFKFICSVNSYPNSIRLYNFFCRLVFVNLFSKL